MQRSSETIGAIAGALAKAQIELANPEKSLTATIRSPVPARRRPELPLRVLVQRARYRPQVAWAGTRSRRSRPPRSTRQPG